jgi:hypothetical protein
LSIFIAFGPVFHSAAFAADDVEEFTFADIATAPTGGTGAGSNRKESTSRPLPVGPDGSLTRQFSIQLPPGRLHFTPSLSLDYSSTNARKGSSVGAGWSFSLPAITRDLRDGVRLTQGAGYIGDRFESPSGALVNAATVPAAERGPTPAAGAQLFVPEREVDGARYEGLAAEDRWIAHWPDGSKHFYGALTGLPSARIVTSLGTYAWLLVRIQDPHGNTQDFEYHAQPGAATLNAKPILARVLWGANPSAGLPHLFEARTEVDPVAQKEIDMLHGRTELRSRVRNIIVGLAYGGPEFWRYQLNYIASRDSGRDLLTSVVRSAPGESNRTTTFSYSNNNGLAAGPHFGPSTALPTGIYNDSRFKGGFDPTAIPTEAKRNARSPKGSRSGFKWLDFDADGDLDVVYHPAGLAGQGSLIRTDSSHERASQGALMPWSSADLHDLPSDREISNLSDLDRDGDIDALGFRSKEVRGYVRAGTLGGDMSNPRGVGVGRSAGGGLPAEYVCEVDTVCEAMCPNPDYTKVCGLIDPPDFSSMPQEPIPGEDIFWDSGWGQPFDDTGWGGAGYQIPPDFFPGRDGYGYDPSDPESIVRPFCGCMPMCLDSTCQMRPIEQPPEQAEDSILGDDPSSPGAWIAFNQAVPGGTIGPRAVTLRNWPEYVLEHFQVSFSASNKAEIYSLTAFETPQADLNGDGRDDVVLTKYKFYPSPAGGPASTPLTTFTPRAYLQRGEHFVTDYAGPYLPGEEPFSAFNASLIEALAGGDDDGCVAEFQCLFDVLLHPRAAGTFEDCAGAISSCIPHEKYPGGVDFNAMLLDINGDRLADLVVAEPPASSGGRRQCREGHRVYLNLGDRFDVWEAPLDRIAPAETWTTPINSPDHPFALLRNRNPFCPGSNDHPSIDPEPASLTNLPVGVSSFADINSDGRIDVVFAYIEAQSGVHRHRVFLNTGSGFAEPSASFAPNYLVSNLFPSTFAFGRVKRAAGASIPPIPEMWIGDWSDVNRLTDVDGDGLVDIMAMGLCTTAQPPNYQTTCQPATWRRNLGVHGDHLTRIEESTGSWSEIQYLWSPQGIQTGRVISALLAPSILVDRINSADGPAAQFPIQTLTLNYREQRTMNISREPLGFEEITAVYQNRFAGVDRESVRVTKRFDVQALVPGVNNEHPLHGLPVLVEEESGTWIRRTRTAYRVDPLGAAARVRQRYSEVEECSGATCLTGRLETTLFGAHGFPLQTVEGQSNNGIFVPNTTRRTVLTYANDTARWIVGRANRQTIYGATRDVHGTVNNNARLTETAWSFVGAQLRTETRVNITPAICAPLPADDATQFEYRPSGQIWRMTRGPRVITVLFDTNDLYPSTKSVPVSSYLDGLSTGTVTLTEHFVHDVRSGQQTRLTDPSGQSWNTSFDSFGRPTQKTGPNGAILSQSTYFDQVTPYRTEVVFQNPTQFFTRRTHFDGAARELASIEGAAGSFFRRSLVRRDAFGRVVEDYLSSTALNMNDLAPGATAFAAMRFDGFDRLVDELKPGSIRRTWTHAPGMST